MWAKTILLFHKEMKSGIIEMKRNIPFLVLPIFLFSFLFLMLKWLPLNEEKVNPISLGLVLEDQSAYGRLLVNSFTQGAPNDFLDVSIGDRSLLQQNYMSGDLDALIILPEGFTSDLMSFKHNPIKVYIHAEDSLKATLLEETFSSYEAYIESVRSSVDIFYSLTNTLLQDSDYQDYNTALSLELIDNTMNRQTFFEENEVSTVAADTSEEYYGVAFLFLGIAYMSLLAGRKVLDRTDSCAQNRLRLTDIPLVLDALCKFIVVLIIEIVFVQVYLVLKEVLGNQELIFLTIKGQLLLMIAILTGSLFSMALAFIVENEKTYILIFEGLLFMQGIIGGILIPLTYLPSKLLKVASWTPFYQWIRSAFVINDKTLSIWDTLDKSIGILFISFFACVIAFVYHQERRWR